MDLGEYIKALRIQRGLTLEELGALVGVGKSTVRKWETGAIANMRKDKIQKLADALGVSPMDLIQEAAPSVVPSINDSFSFEERKLISNWRLASDKSSIDENIVDEMIMQLASRLDRDQILELSKKLIDVAARK